MTAREFHRTGIGEKVLASISNSEHVAKVMAKNVKARKFLLRFHLASGDAREIWRRACSCSRRRVGDVRPMGPTRRAGVTA